MPKLADWLVLTNGFAGLINPSAVGSTHFKILALPFV